MRALAILLLTALTASGAIITGPLQDISAGTYNTSGVEFWPLTTPTANGTSLVVGPKKSVQPTNGNFAVSLVAGRYLVKFLPTTNTVYIWVPNDSGTYTVANLATNASAVATVDQSPLYKVRISSTDSNQNYLAGKILPGSNVTFSTNATAGTITIASTGGGSGFNPTQPTNYNGTFTGNAAGLTNVFYAYTAPAITTNVSTAANLIAAVNNSAAGAVVGIAPGTYLIGTNNLTPPMGVSVVGAGSAVTKIVGYADCWGVEAYSFPSGGPQFSPGDNQWIGGFSLICDTNTMLSYSNAGPGFKHSHMWSGFGMSAKNPPANRSHTNVVVRDVVVSGGWWDAYHYNPASNRCEVTFIDCGGENGGLVWGFYSGTGGNTNSVFNLINCWGTTYGNPPAQLITETALFDGNVLAAIDGAKVNAVGFRGRAIYGAGAYTNAAGCISISDSIPGVEAEINLFASKFECNLPWVNDYTNNKISGNFVWNTNLINRLHRNVSMPGYTPSVVAKGNNIFVTTNGSVYTVAVSNIITTTNLTVPLPSAASPSYIFRLGRSIDDASNFALSVDDFLSPYDLWRWAGGSGFYFETSSPLDANGLNITNIQRSNITGLDNAMNYLSNRTIYASNIVSGGQLPMGTVSSGLSSVAGPMLTTNGSARSYSFDGSALTNLNAASIASGLIPMGRITVTTNEQAGPYLVTDGSGRSYSYNGAGLTNLNAASLASGSVPAARLSGVALSSNSISYATLSGVTTNTGGWVGGLNMTNPATGSFVVVTNGGITAQAGAGYNILTNGVVSLGANAAAATVTADGVNPSLKVVTASGTYPTLTLTNQAGANQGFWITNGIGGGGAQTALRSAGHLIITAGQGTTTYIGNNNNTACLYADNTAITMAVAATASSTLTANSTLRVKGAATFDTTVTATNGFVTIPTIGAGVALTSQGAYILSSSSQTITLPSATTNTGKTIWIKNRNVTSTTVNTVSSQTIDGASTYSLPNAYSGRYFISDGANWLTDGVGL